MPNLKVICKNVAKQIADIILCFTIMIEENDTVHCLGMLSIGP